MTAGWDPAASRTEPRSRRRDRGRNTERFGFMSFTRKEAGLGKTPDANGPAVAPAAAAGRIELGGEVIVNRLGFGAMRLARPSGPQDDGEERRGAPPLSRWADRGRQGWLGWQRARGPTGGDPAPVRAQPHGAAARGDRSLPAAHGRPACPYRGVARGHPRASASGKGSDDRRLERECRRARAGAHGRRHRLGPESLQRWRATLRRGPGALPAGRDRLSSVVSARGGQARASAGT